MDERHTLSEIWGYSLSVSPPPFPISLLVDDVFMRTRNEIWVRYTKMKGMCENTHLLYLRHLQVLLANICSLPKSQMNSHWCSLGRNPGTGMNVTNRSQFKTPEIEYCMVHVLGSNHYISVISYTTSFKKKNLVLKMYNWNICASWFSILPIYVWHMYSST